MAVIVAYVQHTFTDYDELLAEGYDPDSARHFVAAGMGKILQAWSVRGRLTGTSIAKLIFVVAASLTRRCSGIAGCVALA